MSGMETHDGRTVWRRSSDSTLTTAYRRQLPGREFVANQSVYGKSERPYGTTPTFDVTDMRVKCLYRAGATNLSGNRYLVEVRSAPTGNPGSWYAMQTDAHLYFDGSQAVDFRIGVLNVFVEGQLYEIECQVTGGVATLWVDGVQRGSTAAPTTDIGTAQQINVNGSRNISGFAGIGAVSYVDIERASDDALVASYNFEDTDADQAATLLDGSGNGNHLTVTNGYAGMLANTPEGTSDRNELGYSQSIAINRTSTNIWSRAGAVIFGETEPGDFRHVWQADSLNNLYWFGVKNGPWESDEVYNLFDLAVEGRSTSEVLIRELDAQTSVAVSITTDSVFVIERVGSTVTVHVDGTLIYTTTIAVDVQPAAAIYQPLDGNGVTCLTTGKSTSPVDAGEHLAVADGYTPIDKSGDGTTDISGNTASHPGRCEAAADVTGVSCLVGNASMYGSLTKSYGTIQNLDTLDMRIVATVIWDGTDGMIVNAGHGNSYSNNYLWFYGTTLLWDVENSSGGARITLQIAEWFTAGEVAVIDARILNGDMHIYVDGVLAGETLGVNPTPRTANDYIAVMGGNAPASFTSQSSLVSVDITRASDGAPVAHYVACAGAGGILHDVGSQSLHMPITNPYTGMWGTTDSAPSHPQSVGAGWVAAGDGATGSITISPQIPDVGRIECEAIFATDALQDVFNHYNATDKYFELDYNSAGTKKVRFTGAGVPDPSVTSSNSVQPGEVATISVTWNNAAGSVAITLNGVTTSNTGATWATKIQQDWFIGKRWNDTWFLDGSIHYFRMYDAEVGGNLVYELPLDDGIDARNRARSYNGVDNNHEIDGATANTFDTDNAFLILSWVKLNVGGSINFGVERDGSPRQWGYANAGAWYQWPASGNFTTTNSGHFTPGQWDCACSGWQADEALDSKNGSAFSSVVCVGRAQGTTRISIGVRGSTSFADGECGTIMYCNLDEATATKEQVRDWFWNSGVPFKRGDITDADRATYGIKLESYGDETSGDRLSVTGPDMVAVGSPGSVDGPRASQFRELVNGVPATVSGTVERPVVPLASGATGDFHRFRETLDYAQNDDVPWAQATSQDLVLDESGNGNHGTPTGYASPQDVRVEDAPSALAGSVDYSMKFTQDQGQYVVTPSQSLLDGDPTFSVSAWVKAETPEDLSAILFWGSTGAGAGTSFGLCINSDLLIRAEFDFATGASSTNTLTQGEWYHVAVTKTAGAVNGNNLKIYIDASSETLTDITDTTVNIGSNKPFQIGRRTTLDSYEYDGFLADVRVYDRVLNSDEITYLHTNGASGTDPGTANLVGQWGGSDDSFPYATNAFPRSREFGDSQIINGRDKRAYEILEADVTKDSMHYRDAITTEEHNNFLNWQDARQ